QGEQSPDQQQRGRDDVRDVGPHQRSSRVSRAAKREMLTEPTNPISETTTRIGSVVDCRLYAASIARPATIVAASTSMATARLSMFGHSVIRISATIAAVPDNA